MPRRRAVVGVAWWGALALLVALVGVAQVAWPQAVVASEDRCPMLLQRKDQVPAWLWALAVPPGSRLVDVQDDIDALQAQDTVEDVLVVPTSTPAGVDARVYDFGFLYPEPGEEVFTYRPVLCLGGEVPDVVGLDADDARALVTANGLMAAIAGDPAGVVATVVPGVGTVLEFGSEVAVSMVPVPAAPATEPPESASGAGGGTTGEATESGPAETQDRGQSQGGDTEPRAADPGSPTSAQAEVGRLLGDWGWLVVVAVAGAGLAWVTARALRRGRERRWLRQHLRAQAEAGPDAVSVQEDARQQRHTVRLTPTSGPVDLDVDERGSR